MMVSHRPVDQALAVVVQQRVVRPGHRRARGQQDQRVQQRQVPRIEGAAERHVVGARRRRPDMAEQIAAQELVRVGRETARC